MKIAICTSSGKNVDLHFGKTSTFYVYSVNHGEKIFEDKRSISPYCATDEYENSLGTHTVQLDKLKNIFEAINDCTKLYTVSIGEKPKEELEKLGLTVQLCDCPIDSIPTCSGNCKSKE